MIWWWKPPTAPDPLLPRSRHQAMKAILLRSLAPRPPLRWWQAAIAYLDAVLWP